MKPQTEGLERAWLLVQEMIWEYQQDPCLRFLGVWETGHCRIWTWFSRWLVCGRFVLVIARCGLANEFEFCFAMGARQTYGFLRFQFACM